MTFQLQDRKLITFLVYFMICTDFIDFNRLYFQRNKPFSFDCHVVKVCGIIWLFRIWNKFVHKDNATNIHKIFVANGQIVFPS